MSYKGQEIFQRISERVELRFDEPLSRHTTLRVGGNTFCYARVRFLDDLMELINICRVNGIRYIVVGGGSNILMPDEGFDGLVISLSGMNRIERVNESTLRIGAGAMLSYIVRDVAERGLSGMEGLYGIPGTIGGAIYGNAGAFGYEIKDIVSKVVILRDNSLLVLDRSSIDFRYRGSGLSGEDIIIEAEFIFKKDSPSSINKRMDEFLMEKKMRQPLGEYSLGCVFKNPEGISAGRLIEEAGCKGMSEGGMEVSSIHANFIINRGNGKSGDFLILMEKIQEIVFSRFSIMLEPEIRRLL